MTWLEGSSLLYGAVRLCRNLLLDLRFGAFLGGTIRTTHAGLGAHDVSNSDYRALSYLFANRILQTDVLVDIGCGKGRVLNWWLSLGISNQLIGIELDERVARRTAARLRNFRNVHVVAGDAIERLPVAGTLFYLFNPFTATNLRRLRDKLALLRPLERRLIIIYYNCVDIELFTEDPRWQVERLALPDPRLHPAAVVTRIRLGSGASPPLQPTALGSLPSGR